MMQRRQFIASGAATAVGVGLWRIDGVATAEESPGYAAEFTFGEDGTFTGVITEPDGTINDLTGTHTVRSTSQTSVISGPTVLPGLVVQYGEVVEFDPDVSTHLQVTGNIVVAGTLRMRPSSPDVVHTIEFVDVDESQFVGGGMVPLESDVGLWVVADGVLDAAGSPKTSWTRTAAGVDQGATVLSFPSQPSGWRVGDALAVAPTAPGDRQSHECTVTAINGSDVSVSPPIPAARPAVVVDGATYTPEVANLTRNVRIIGAPLHRAHVAWMHVNNPVHIADVEFADLGPILPEHTFDALEGAGGFYSAVPVGRWAVHLHHGGANLSGSTFDRCVAHHIGSHGFVPHMVDGVTMTDCVTFDTGAEGFWWDTTLATNGNGADSSDNITWHRCLALHIRRVSQAYNGAVVVNEHPIGFQGPLGSGNVMSECVAVGDQGQWNRRAAGFGWMSGGNFEDQGWTTVDCVAHNCSDGFDIWVNGTSLPTFIERFTAYNCVSTGIFDGAYGNHIRWVDCRLAGNGYLSSASQLTAEPKVSGLFSDGTGAAYAFLCSGKNVDTTGKTVVVDGARLVAGSEAAIVVETGSPHPHRYRFVQPQITGNEFWFRPNVNAGSMLIYETGMQVLELRPDTYTGDTSAMTWSALWNCWVLDIT